MTTLERTTVKLLGDVILTAGMGIGTGQIFGCFADEADALSEDADNLALGKIGPEQLTADQIALAERNSERITEMLNT